MSNEKRKTRGKSSSSKSTRRSQLEAELEYLKEKTELDKRQKELEIQQAQISAQRQIMEMKRELITIDEISQVLSDDDSDISKSTHNDQNDDVKHSNHDESANSIRHNEVSVDKVAHNRISNNDNVALLSNVPYTNTHNCVDIQPKFPDIQITKSNCIESEVLLKAMPQETQEDRVNCLFAKGSEPRASITDLQLNTTDLLARSLMRMKPLQIKKFNGDPQYFAQFHARFLSLEEDHCYSNRELLQILLDHVEGKAEQALKGFLPGSTQYVEAMSTLNQRFGQTTQIIKAHEANLRHHSKIDKRNPASLRSLTDSLTTLICSYKSLNLIAELSSSSNLVLVLEKLPIDMKIKWERDIAFKKYRASLENLQSWLEMECTILERAYSYKSEEKFTTESSRMKKITMMSESKTPMCILHENSKHYTRECLKIKNMPASNRVELISTNKLCWLCMNPRHGRCTYRITCEVCNGKHHTLAHENVIAYRSQRQETKNQTNKESERSNEQPKPNQMIHNQTYSAQTQEIKKEICSLPLVNIIVKGLTGSKKTTALLDTGSDTTYISQELASALNLSGKEDSILLSGINGQKQQKVTILDSVTITTSHAKKKRRQEYTMKQVLVRQHQFPNLIPQIDWSTEKYKYHHLQDLPLPTTSKVEVIIGCDQSYLLRPLKARESNANDPIALNTRLGWTVISNTSAINQRSSYVASATLDKQLTEWFSMEMEPLHTAQIVQSYEDKIASDLLETGTHKLEDENRYVVPILWKDRTEDLPNNRDQAEKQWMQLEKRLDRDEKLKNSYIKSLHTDLQKGFIEKMTAEELTGTVTRQQYIVHHPVIHPHKPDKVRRVYNFSNKYQGQSLNDRIYNGPDLLNSLTGVLTRFRTGNICLAADISDMFLQMKVKSEDEPSLRFLFRESKDQEIETYKCVRRPLGERSAPCCANYTIQKCCEDNKVQYPQAAEVASKSFYVDDCLTSVNDTNQAKDLVQDLKQLLSKGSFNLTKWMSNSKEVMEVVPKEDQYKGIKRLNNELTSATRTLGTVYDPNNDCFIAEVAPKYPASTPREFLSRISSVWDPLGHFSPFIIQGRSLQRESFIQKLHWDSLVPDNLLQKWRKWEEILNQLDGIEIPRQLKSRSEIGQPTLIAFADASKLAKCAATYIRTEYDDNTAEARLLMARTKLSPMKVTSIPRLELDAFLMAVRLVKSNLTELNLHIPEITLFTDSSTVLHWVVQPSGKYRDYVAHRISDIQEDIKVIEDKGTKVTVRYCPTKENVADEGTRGLKPNQLTKESRWQTGPSFLKQPPSTWPTRPHEEESPEIKEEVRKQCLITTCNSTSPVIDLKKYSSLTKALRVLARCMRWKNKNSGAISSDELTESEVKLLKLHQNQMFPEELSCLKEGNEVSKCSRLKRLVPFLDKDGIIRVKGRLTYAPIAYTAKHPVIIDGNAHLANLLVSRTHHQTNHGSVSHIINELRQKYWILRIKQTVKAFNSKCFYCKKQRAKPTPPLMADLPPVRVTPNDPPFTAVMCDYFGPIQVKERMSTRRSVQQKRWGCLFTCLATRAVHLEVVNSLSTDAFINCFIRFASRRGTCTDIYSDRGTNFIGASKELLFDEDKVVNALQIKSIHWHFGSPLSPHKTGAVERLVRSVKRSLRSLEAKVFTSDVLHTSLVAIEGTLNSRPLTELPEPEGDSRDLTALTPNHILLLKPQVNVPIECTDKDANSRKCYKQALATAQAFWSRWIKEYLPTLMQRSKWYFEQKEPKVGELVLCADDGVSRHQWPLARIIEVIRSSDQRIRSVRLKMRNGEYVRPVVKICRLEDD